MDLRLKNVLQWIALLLIGFPVPSFGGNVEILNLGQAHVNYPLVAVYIDALDETETAVDTLLKEQINASVGGTWVAVTSLESFSKTEEGIGYVFLVDVSKSLEAGQFDQIKAALSDWIDTMSLKKY